MSTMTMHTAEALSAFEAQRIAGYGGGGGLDQLRPHLGVVRVALDRLGPHLPAGVEPETLEGLAILALIEAAQQMPPAAPAFASYARLHVRRALAAGLGQSHDFVSRAGATLGQITRAAEAALLVGKEGGDDELAALLGTSVEELRSGLEQVASLMVAAPQSVLETPPATGGRQRQVADAVCALPGREQLIIALYYFEDLTFAEIAQTLGITEPEAQWAFGRAAVMLRVHLARKEAATSATARQAPR
jgi:RNA polymerase sigma factor FliA